MIFSITSQLPKFKYGDEKLSSRFLSKFYSLKRKTGQLRGQKTFPLATSLGIYYPITQSFDLPRRLQLLILA